MKICTKCGARMSDSNRFCEKCGSTLVTETAAGHTAVPVRSETSLSQLVGWLQKYGRHIMRVAALLAVVLFFCPLCRGVAVLVLDNGAVDGKGGAIRELGFHPVGVHIEAAGKQFVHTETSMFFTFASFTVESSGCPFANP